MYVCLCAQVDEREICAVIRAGARCPDSVAAACGAGRSCGTCAERIDDLLDTETAGNTLVGLLALRD